MLVNTLNEQQMGLFADSLSILRDCGMGNEAIAVEGHRMLDGILYVHEDFLTVVLEGYVQRAQLLHTAMQTIREQSKSWSPDVKVDTFIANGTQSTFTLTNRYPKDVLSIKVNGREQTKGIFSSKPGTAQHDAEVLVDFSNHTVLFPRNLNEGATVKVAYIPAVD